MLDGLGRSTSIELMGEIIAFSFLILMLRESLILKTNVYIGAR